MDQYSGSPKRGPIFTGPRPEDTILSLVCGHVVFLSFDNIDSNDDDMM